VAILIIDSEFPRGCTTEHKERKTAIVSYVVVDAILGFWAMVSRDGISKYPHLCYDVKIAIISTGD
jgi:hypothetical protein